MFAVKFHLESALTLHWSRSTAFFGHPASDQRDITVHRNISLLGRRERLYFFIKVFFSLNLKKIHRLAEPRSAFLIISFSFLLFVPPLHSFSSSSLLLFLLLLFIFVCMSCPFTSFVILSFSSSSLLDPSLHYSSSKSYSFFFLFSSTFSVCSPTYLLPVIFFIYSFLSFPPKISFQPLSLFLSFFFLLSFLSSFPFLPNISF